MNFHLIRKVLKWIEADVQKRGCIMNQVKSDVDVIVAFYEKREAEYGVLWTDGTMLYSHGILIGRWVGEAVRSYYAESKGKGFEFHLGLMLTWFITHDYGAGNDLSLLRKMTQEEIDAEVHKVEIALHRAATL